MDAAATHLDEAAALLHQAALENLPDHVDVEARSVVAVPCALRTRTEDGAVVIEVAGGCGLASVPSLIRLARQSAAQASVVVIDFTHATSLDHVAIAALHRVEREARERGTRLAVCGGAATVVDELRRGRLQPFADVESAMGGKASGPRLAVQWELSPEASGLVEARNKVRQTCLSWRVPVGVANSVVDVASELLSNAFQHGKTPVVLSLQVSTTTVRVEVSDASSKPARPRPYRSGVSESGLGLRLVEHISSSWGQIPHDDGKSVWALLSLSEPAADAGRH